MRFAGVFFAPLAHVRTTETPQVSSRAQRSQQCPRFARSDRRSSRRGKLLKSTTLAGTRRRVKQRADLLGLGANDKPATAWAPPPEEVAAAEKALAKKSKEGTGEVKALEKAEGTVSVLDKDGVVFTRVWCCYEIFVSLAVSSRLSIMP